jgi:hypothetical protein
MASERKFETKVLKVREKELKAQRLNYTIEASRCPKLDALSDDKKSLDIVEGDLVITAFRQHWALLTDKVVILGQARRFL